MQGARRHCFYRQTKICCVLLRSLRCGEGRRGGRPGRRRRRLAGDQGHRRQRRGAQRSSDPLLAAPCFRMCMSFSMMSARLQTANHAPGEQQTLDGSMTSATIARSSGPSTVMAGRLLILVPICTFHAMSHDVVIVCAAPCCRQRGLMLISARARRRMLLGPPPTPRPSTPLPPTTPPVRPGRFLGASVGFRICCLGSAECIRVASACGSTREARFRGSAA